MMGGLTLILTGIIFAFFGIGGRGRVSSSGFVVSAGSGIILFIVGVLVLAR